MICPRIGCSRERRPNRINGSYYSSAERKQGIGFGIRKKMKIPGSRLNARFASLVEILAVHICTRPLWRYQHRHYGIVGAHLMARVRLANEPRFRIKSSINGLWLRRRELDGFEEKGNYRTSVIRRERKREGKRC